MRDFKMTEKTETGVVLSPIFPDLPQQINRGNLRKYAATCFSILEFGKSGTKSYRSQKDKPNWFPAEIDWDEFECPSYASTSNLKKIISSLFKHYGIVGQSDKLKRKTVKNNSRPNKPDSHGESLNNMPKTNEKQTKGLTAYEKFMRKSPESRQEELKLRQKRKREKEVIGDCLECQHPTKVGTKCSNCENFL